MKHEDLMGGMGRAIYYRSKRQVVRQLLSKQEAILVLGDTEQYPIHDVSMNGLSFFASKQGRQWQPDEELTARVVIQDREIPRGETHEKEEVFYGPIRIARADEKTGAFHVGVQLLDGFLDIPRLQWNYEERMLRRDLQEGPSSIENAVPDEFRKTTDRLAFFLQFYRQSLLHHEGRYRQMGKEGFEAISERAPRAVIQALRGPWARFLEASSSAMLPHMRDAGALRAAKKYMECFVTPQLMDAPFVARAYTKPLGYAGDYQTMFHIYENRFEGESLFAQAIHKLFCEAPLSQGVRERRTLVAKYHDAQYSSFCARAPEGAMFRVTNVGSGAAGEVANFLSARKDWPRPVSWTLMDQEEEALSLAYADLYPRMSQLSPRRTVNCLYMSFLQFLSDPKSTVGRQPQDFIYSMGLFDYIQENRASKIVRALYDCLAPGGFLAICNGKDPSPQFSICEFVLDWPLIYRTDEQMLRIAKEIPNEAEIAIEPVPSDSFHYLLVKKPG